MTRATMDFSTSEQVLLMAALASHKFRLKHQLDLFSGLDPVFKEAVEREIHTCDVLKEKLEKSRTGQ